jgi:hypothetical protein
MQVLIDDSLINDIRKNPSENTFFFGSVEDDNVIVPANLTHEHLRSISKIDSNILKYYFYPSTNLISSEEFQTQTSGWYQGHRDLYLRPYSVITFGAFHSRLDLYEKLRLLLPLENVYGIELPFREIRDLIPYFKEYARGFEKGYNEFVNTCVKPYLLVPDDKQDFVYKVFEFLTNNDRPEASWIAPVQGFTINTNLDGEVRITDGFENGVNQGCFYRAWSIVLGSHQNFKELFATIHWPATIKPEKRHAAKWYSLLYGLNLEMLGEEPPRNSNGNFDKSAIMEIAINNYEFTDGQSFYDKFKKIGNFDERNIKRMYGINWKDTILALAKDNSLLQQYIIAK